ncbi:MAG: glycosyltransferase family 4 protein [Treponema sp.]|nr:glycosyltransferase family 4 protein [Treponema sp.]
MKGSKVLQRPAGRPCLVFILPARDEAPVGGYKVVYRYADLFALDGYEVHLVYPHVKPELLAGVRNPLLRLKMRLGFLYRRYIRKQFRLGDWFAFKGKVHRDYLFTVGPFLPFRYRPSAKFIATAVETSYWISALHGVAGHRGYYFIQDFENWKHADGYVLDSYRMPLKKAVISSWLKDKVAEVGEEAVLVPDAVDSSEFSLTQDIGSRNPFEVALLYHTDERKRTDDILAALAKVKESCPQLHATAFGVEPRPEGLPDWYSYVQRPDGETHRRIYNQAAVFVAASRAEGWGLTVCEAMLCGCAIACTDAGGFREFCTDGETALMSPPLAVDALAENVQRLVEDDELRIRLATAGNRAIQNFTWERSFATMKAFLEISPELE